MDKKVLFIEEGTKHISNQEYQNADYTELILPDTLEVIGDFAFQGCTELQFIKLPDGLKKIGQGAFQDCVNLKEIYIPASVEEIDENAFTHYNLIYCERFLKPEGWFFQFEEGDRGSLDLDDDICFRHYYRTWFGSFSYELTFDEYIVEGKQYRYDREKHIIWGRSWGYFLQDSGIWHFDMFSYLEDLGEERLRKGMVPGWNPIMKELLEEIKTKMENEFTENDSIISAVKLYYETIIELFAIEGHELEFLFCSYSLYHYLWQLSQVVWCCRKRKAWVNVSMVKKEEYSELLQEIGGKRWEKIKDCLEGIDLHSAKLVSMIKRYYQSYDKRIEQDIFDEYDDMYFKSISRQDEETIQAGNRYYQKAKEFMQKEDLEEAIKCFEKSAKCGHKDGQYHYGMQLMEEGCRERFLEASYWYWKAAMQEHDNAMLKLGDNYRVGDGVHLDGVKMIYWYTKAAQELNAQAVYKLGLCLKNEEVISGKRSTGLSLMNASEELEEEDVARYVLQVTEKVLSALGEANNDYMRRRLP